MRGDDGCYINARCYHSQKKNEEAHKLQLKITRSGVMISEAFCTCVKGKSQSCGHVVGLLYQIAAYKMSGRKAIPQDVAKTSLPQTWHRPRGEKIRGEEVQNLTFQGYSKKQLPGNDEKRDGIKSTLYNPIRRSLPPLTELHNSVLITYPDSLILPSLNLTTSDIVKTKFGDFPKGSVLSYQQKLHGDFVLNVYDGVEFPNLPLQNKIINNYVSSVDEEPVVIDTLKLSISEIHLLETQTRLQGECELWHKLRSNRITASKVHRIKTRQKDFEGLAKTLCSTSHRTTQAMRDGLADEPKAAESYVTMAQNNLNIYPCGIVISPWAPWLAVSPDRKVYDPNSTPSFGLLEIKCPRVQSVLECRYLVNIDGQLRLKESHEYFTQIQTQLAVTGVEWCDFYVWCHHDVHKERIQFDPIFWQNVKDKIDNFFFKFFIRSH